MGISHLCHPSFIHVHRQHNAHKKSEKTVDNIFICTKSYSDLTQRCDEMWYLNVIFFRNPLVFRLKKNVYLCYLFFFSIYFFLFFFCCWVIIFCFSFYLHYIILRSLWTELCNLSTFMFWMKGIITAKI